MTKITESAIEIAIELLEMQGYQYPSPVVATSMSVTQEDKTLGIFKLRKRKNP